MVDGASGEARYIYPRGEEEVDPRETRDGASEGMGEVDRGAVGEVN